MKIVYSEIHGPGRKWQSLPVAKVDLLQPAAEPRREIIPEKVVEPPRGIALEKPIAIAEYFLLISFTAEILHYLGEVKWESNSLVVELNLFQGIKCSGVFQIRCGTRVAMAKTDIAGPKLKKSNIPGHASVGRDR